MTTALDLITSAMRKTGFLTMIETPDADVAADGLVMLNDLLDSWSTESLLIVSRSLETFNLSGGVGSYTIGVGATFDTVRPTLIVASYITFGTTDYSQEIIDDTNFARITQKITQSSLPDYLNYDNAFPVATIKLWPVPSTSYTITLLTEKPIITFAATTSTVSLPQGWKRAIIYNLAEEMAPEYGQPISGDVARIAKQSKIAIKRAITKNRTMDVPSQLGNFDTIYTGYNN